MVIGDRKVVLKAGVCLLLLLLIAPYVSASVDSTSIPASKDPNAIDNPELISAFKLHTAYLGQGQEARMDSVISYIDNISGGTGTSNLEQIEDDYLVIASSIPLMTTNAEITRARDDMRVQTQLFSEDTKAQLVMFNGSTDDMRANIATSEQAANSTITNFTDSLWLAKDSARLTIFNTDSQQRALLLLSLDRQGIDTTLARNISDQIDAQRASLQDSLTNNSADSLVTVNTGIRMLNRQFRKTVEDSQAAMAIELKRQALMAMK
ncbi:hypothetical protein [Methanoregula sp.]|jgi:hypothetical protein|uniref:hypothetical protein n=1 Tax=Methanoregula sp. TaxID=2052170 RepID=UPI003C158E2C